MENFALPIGWKKKAEFTKFPRSLLFEICFYEKWTLPLPRSMFWWLILFMNDPFYYIKHWPIILKCHLRLSIRKHFYFLLKCTRCKVFDLWRTFFSIGAVHNLRLGWGVKNVQKLSTWFMDNPQQRLGGLWSRWQVGTHLSTFAHSKISPSDSLAHTRQAIKGVYSKSYNNPIFS